MKTTNRISTGILIAILLLISTVSFSQDDERPQYITVTTMYWNQDSDMTLKEWKAMEKEYMDKVTSKNEYVNSARYYMHLMTDNSNEVLYVQSYKDWAAIEATAKRRSELEKEAWPDEDARKAFLKKMNSAFAPMHSDEIYATLPGAKVMETEVTDGMVLYVRKNKMAFPEDGSWDELKGLADRMEQNVIHKNDFIKAYYPNQHAWGSDRRDFIQAFYLDSMEDMEKMFDKNQELMKEEFTEEEGKTMGKYFEGHGDYVYSVVVL